MASSVKEADLAGPGIGDYGELEHVLPDDYTPLLDPIETMRGLYAAKRLIEDGLCEELGLTQVQVPLIVDRESGVNDYLDRDGIAHARRVPHRQRPRASTRSTPRSCRRRRSGSGSRYASSAWGPAKGCSPTCARCARTTSSTTTTAPTSTSGTGRRRSGREERTLEFLTATVGRSGRCSRRPRTPLHERYPALGEAYPSLPGRARVHPRRGHPRRVPRPAAQAARDGDPAGASRRSSSTGSAGRSPTASRTSCARPTTTTGSTETRSADGRPMHGLNGDILVWNPVTQRRHELSPMGIRVTKESLVAAARALRPARLPRAAVPPGDHARRDPALDRRRDRAVAHDDAPPAQGPPGRGERQRLAGRAQAHVRRARHPRTRMNRKEEQWPRSHVRHI